ncbi:MAG TPA: UvrD-helicase domain-containing protein, partial [Thermoanaerobaculia bacterium]|nr:UvrD-helicase domain-containing protein [Thermoanaerobaculia bacterium]
LRDAFLRIAEHPDVTPVSQHTPRPDLSGALKKLVAFIDRVAPLMPPDDGHEPDGFEKMMRWLIRRRRTKDLTDPFEQFALLDEGDHASRKPVQKRWPDKGIAKQLGIDYADLVNTTIRPAVQQWREHVHGIAIDLLRPAAQAFAEERRRNGTLTFADLLVCARDLLRDHPNVRRYFQKRFTHVFVDEFQDTDPVQAEVLMFLTGEDVDERNWRKLRPRPGSLFIVGDPKQSIYRFRRADITTYLDVKKLIERSGGRVVKLSTNFRSMPAICAYVNDVFPSLFDPRDVAKGRQAEHVDLEAFHDGDASVVSLETPDNRKLDAMACAEAEVVGKWIRDKVEKGDLQWNDVMLVSWFRPRLRCYARIFETLGIPYEVTGSRAFKEFEELERAMPLLRAVATPDDEVAIVAFLVGPLCGADDDALYRFRMAGGRFSPFGGAPAPPPAVDSRIARGLRIIRESIDDARGHPPAAAIARIFDRAGVLALSASGERPGTRSGNLMLALSIARELSAAGESLATIVEQFGELLEVKPDSIEELDIDPKRENAVHLMNLHQVKGLEAPVVFLIDPSDVREFDIDLHVDRSGDESLGYFAIKRDWKTIGLPRGWDAFEKTEKDFRRTEHARLLYVAATRAMKMLVVGFRTSQGTVKGAWSQLASRISAKLEWSDALQRADGGLKPAATPLPDIAAQFEAARASSYSVLPITKIAHGSFAELVKAEEGLGKGTSWGRVLHRLFEAMLRDESLDIRLYAGNLLKDEERDPVELDEVMRVIDAVRGSALWSRVKAADERYVEIPFALNVSRRDVGIDEGGETLLHGTIDLVFREHDRWFIVDYKSDSTAGRVDALVDYYAPQVRYYARFWTQLTNAPASAGLFFVDGCIEKWVTATPGGFS